jgi:hypothetical protein
MYEVEDVVAAIFHGLMTKQHVLVVQAARELRVSLEDDLLLNVVIMAWLLCDPYKCPMTHVPTKETVYESLCTIMDHFPSELPKYKAQIPVPMPPNQSVLEAAIQTCFTKKYPKQCIRILSMLLHKMPTTCYTLLEKHGVSKTLVNLFDHIVYSPLAERLLQHIVIQIMYSLSSSSSKYIQKYVNVWNTTTAGRAARTFSIPFQALTLWNIKPKLATRIQNSLVPTAVQTDPTLYWQSAGTPTEETMEVWYAAHFQDDIPDEWSREEIEKSHVYSLTAAESTAKTDWQPAFLLCW